ncbi:hypothetical protein [Oceanirhabdus sp. W0125-5]|uniref:hypothetical protein n=1 Tax=Oceanirhabdus sp. W0125-5 TaxID=2999116 RepID=UPI0022F2EAE7|nr:hypothetical protein [Oceanirhabdus sp. W0125-5]WBW95078.1 hypothetical protein OW730_15435 [Oceanirhabdus sp. W0125-5]
MRSIEINETEYSMMPLRMYSEFLYLPLYERVKEFDFIDFNDMFCEDSILPFNKYIQKKSNDLPFQHATDYHKEFFATFNPEDNDGLISTDEGMI